MIDTRLKLMGWSRERRVVVMRRQIPVNTLRQRKEPGWLPHLDGLVTVNKWEYAVVVCSADLALDSVPTLYADRADCENVLDELKNQWGLSGFTTKDLKRCKVMARLTALVCNWWNVFLRIAEPTEHMEALTSRPELLHLMAIADHACWQEGLALLFSPRELIPREAGFRPSSQGFLVHRVYCGAVGPADGLGHPSLSGFLCLAAWKSAQSAVGGGNSHPQTGPGASSGAGLTYQHDFDDERKTAP